MATIQQWRTLGGALVTWTETGIGRFDQPSGDWNCQGCGISRTNANSCYPEQHSTRCRQVLLVPEENGPSS